ncbi:selenocysteine lyase [Fistulina hepatica ATCC 64428]|uniref:Selenocysteine lyase n=1 Tax=Fistulina hepatica ATCC 64428 TaxID=1128425 RepID=A0A0D7A7R9_9AGAR|nr:selenocysteine lyase [Fistulina hepatica ATCC 64428]
MLDIENVRASFPALSSNNKPYIFADSAGGSQTVKDVADRMYDYLTNSNVQLGADYSVSALSTKRVMHEGPRAAMELFNAESPEEIAFGMSSTMNLENLARSLDNDVHSDEEIIITGEHEGNIGCWKHLAARVGAVIRHWSPRQMEGSSNPYEIYYDTKDLVPLITAKTRIVAFSACSNILGSLAPVKDVVHAIRCAARTHGARKVEVSVDCVAYAPHRRMDVRDWDVDYCVFSFYKVYGPHVSALYVRRTALIASVSSIVHHFLDVSTSGYKLQPGGPGYELVYAATGVLPYLRNLTPVRDLRATWDAVALHEQTLLVPLLEFLTHPDQRTRGVRVVGDETPSLARAPTISFVVIGERPIRSRDVVAVFDAEGDIGIRYGHFYAFTLIDQLRPKIDPADGVVRISLVHYNTVEEVQRLIKVLKKVLA